jgi:hypothetical protein
MSDPIPGYPPEPKTIKEIYPRYSQRLLDVMVDEYLDETVRYLENTDRAHYDLTNTLATLPLSSEARARIKGQKIISMSLYFKAANFAHRKNHPIVGGFDQIPMSELERTRHPMWEGTNRYEHTFLENYLNKVIDADFGDWVPVVYLSKDLSVLEPILKSRGWVVINVQHSGLAECPGAMWRYLSFNLDCRCCYIQDTDRAFEPKRPEHLLRLIERFENAALIRPLQWSSPNAEMSLILGNDFLVRPAKINFDVTRMVLGYIVLNVLHEDRINNFVHERARNRDDTKIIPLSKRLTREHIGPHPHERAANKNYPYYAFDEQWLKEFVYYHLSDGRIITLLRNSVKSDDICQRLDLEYQRQMGDILLSREEEAALENPPGS